MPDEISTTDILFLYDIPSGRVDFPIIVRLRRIRPADILQQQPVHFPHLTGTIPDVPRYLRCPLQHRSGYHR